MLQVIGLQILGRQPLVAIGRHEAGRNMQGVALLQRQVERAAKQLHHLAARLRAAGFQKTNMPGGYVRVARQFDLGEAADVAPVLQQAAEMSGGDIIRDQVLSAHGISLGFQIRRSITSNVSHGAQE
jgi:hypothetical protein